MSSQQNQNVDDTAEAGAMVTETARCVQIFAGGKADTHALEELLGPHYDVVTDDTVQDVDCYLVDDQTLPRYREALLDRKRDAHPTFCPVLLIHRDDTHVHVDLSDVELDADGIQLVDDIIEAPVTRETLTRRVENLLARRAQSLELAREFERVEQWFRGLFSALPDPAFVLDTDGRIRALNDAFCALVGEDRAELVGEPIVSIPTSGTALEGLQTAVETGENGDIETDGELVDLTPERDSRSEFGQLSVQTTEVGGDRYVVGILSDVTELKHKTERLEKLASVLSHDLRNPIQVAELNLQALQASLPEERDEVEAVERAIDRIEDLTEKLVSVARTGEEALKREAVEVESCSRRAWDGVATERAELLVESEETPQCQVDQVRFEQLLGNLFRNAIDHGGEDVTVWFGWEDSGFYVEDDGLGIPADERERIFEMGYSNHPGGGLGLAIVSEIAQAHGWEVTVTEGRKGGARFEFSGVESVY